MLRKDNDTTRNLLGTNYLYHQKHYKLMGIDLSKQINKTIPQQINFLGNVKEFCVAVSWFITTTNFIQQSLNSSSVQV